MTKIHNVVLGVAVLALFSLTVALTGCSNVSAVNGDKAGCLLYPFASAETTCGIKPKSENTCAEGCGCSESCKDGNCDCTDCKCKDCPKKACSCGDDCKCCDGCKGGECTCGDDCKCCENCKK